MRKWQVLGLLASAAWASGCGLSESLVDGFYQGISGIVAGVIESLVLRGAG